jgi:hypothetical protein
MDEQFNLINTLNLTSKIIILSYISENINIKNNKQLLNIYVNLIQNISIIFSQNIISDNIIDDISLKIINKQLENVYNAIETNITFYRTDGIELKGGNESNEIWPLITIKWEKNENLLGLKSLLTDKIKFKFILHNKDKNYKPILGKGSSSAIYHIENAIIELDKTKYILRI